MGNFLSIIAHSLYAAAGMFWLMFWALVLGFALSGIVMAFVPKGKMVAMLGEPGPRQLGLAALFGAASSSCSYAATSTARSIFQKGAHIIPALAFMLASTNLVVELSIVLWLLLGWQFVLAEIVGGLLMIAIMATLLRLFAPLGAFEERRRLLNRELPSADGIDEAEPTHGIHSLEGWQSAAQAFVSEWRMIGKDILLGVVISGFLMTCVPDSFWQSLFLQRGPQTHGWLKLIENALVGPLVSALSFLCSVGNIPLAGVLYHGGISFGGTLSFIYADLIIIPLILIYRRFYGWRLAAWITGVFYASMVLAGLIVEVAFAAAGLVPRAPAVKIQDMGFFRIDSTFWLNLTFGVIAISCVILARTAKGTSPGDGRCCHD